MKSGIKTSISIFLVPFWYFCEHISISCWRVVVYRELLPHIRIIILLTLCPGSLQRGHKRGVVIILNSLAPDSDHYLSWPIVTRKQELETMYYSVGFHVPHSVELKCKKYNVSDLSLCIFFSIHDYFLIATLLRWILTVQILGQFFASKKYDWWLVYYTILPSLLLCGNYFACERTRC